jgi:hypothetical protein
MRWMWAVIATFCGMASAQAYTCADVRALSAEQQAYYIKAFNITPAQQEQIRQTCYGGRTHHAITVSDERAANRPAQGEPNKLAD